MIIYTAGHVWRWAFMVGILGIPFATLNAINLWQGKSSRRIVPLLGFVAGFIMLILGIRLYGLVATGHDEMLSLIPYLHNDSLSAGYLGCWAWVTFVATVTVRIVLGGRSKLSSFKLKGIVIAGLILSGLGIAVYLNNILDKILSEQITYRNDCMWLFITPHRVVYNATFGHSIFTISIGLLYVLLAWVAYFRLQKQNPLDVEDVNESNTSVENGEV